MKTYALLGAQSPTQPVPTIIEFRTLDDDANIFTLYHPDVPWHDVTGVTPAPQLGWTATEANGIWGFAPAAAPRIDLKAYAASARYAREIAGLTVGGIAIDTSEDSQNRIANAWALLQASGAPSISYKAVSGFVTLTSDQFRTLALAVGSHVQACFAVEAQLAAGIAAGTITSAAQIDAAFVASVT